MISLIQFAKQTYLSFSGILIISRLWKKGGLRTSPSPANDSRKEKLQGQRLVMCSGDNLRDWNYSWQPSYFHWLRLACPHELQKKTYSEVFHCWISLPVFDCRIRYTRRYYVCYECYIHWTQHIKEQPLPADWTEQRLLFLCSFLGNVYWNKNILITFGRWDVVKEKLSEIFFLCPKFHQTSSCFS